MNVERGKFEGEETPEAKARRAWMEALDAKMRADPRCAELFEPFDEEASDARADADIAAGRTYSHYLVAEWLKTCGDPDFKPFHEWLK